MRNPNASLSLTPSISYALPFPAPSYREKNAKSKKPKIPTMIAREGGRGSETPPRLMLSAGGQPKRKQTS